MQYKYLRAVNFMDFSWDLTDIRNIIFIFRNQEYHNSNKEKIDNTNTNTTNNDNK